MTRRVHLTFDVGENLGSALYLQEAIKRDLNRFLTEGWPTAAKLDGSSAAWSQVEPQGTSVILELGPEALAFVHVGFGNAFVRVAAANAEAARAAMDEVRALLLRAQRDQDGRVPVTFWSYGPHGPMPMGRRLAVPAWEEITGHYPPETAGALSRVMSGDSRGAAASSSCGTERRARARRRRCGPWPGSGPRGASRTTSRIPRSSSGSSRTTCSR
jgi:hypothetical protein